MEPEKPATPLSAGERLARDARQEAALFRNMLHFSLWTLAALIPTMLLLLVDMSVLWRVITFVLCAGFWVMAIGGMFRMTGLLDAGRRSVSLNPFHAGKGEAKDQKKK